MARPRKYQLPDYLVGDVTQERYQRWLDRKAQAHVRRDRRRGNRSATGAQYKVAVHDAVKESDGRDYYTGEPLDWSLISTYDNVRSKAGGRKYKALFALLPTVDHVEDGRGPADFKICGWRTNNAKADLSFKEFHELCERVLKHSRH